MHLVADNGRYQVYFDCTRQYYVVYYNGNVLVSHKYKFSDVKSYAEPTNHPARQVKKQPVTYPFIQYVIGMAAKL